jgi:glycosyltransferase involved in cell wall biosynthesis
MLRGAAALVALSWHVAGQLQLVAGGRPILHSRLSPLNYGPAAASPMAHGGRLRLLSFGRLLPYKGLDLLALALAPIEPGRLEVRVVGTGPESPDLARLRTIPGVTVENRWVPEAELGALLGWADALVLSHREASQSGVAAAALAAGRWVVATRVGGLAEQLEGYQAARLCEPEAGSLAAAIESLLRDPPPDAATGHGWQDSVVALARDLAGVFGR